MRFGKKFSGIKARSASRRRARDPWSRESKIERLLIETSERIVKANSAMTDALDDVRKGRDSRARDAIYYLQRLIREAHRYIDQADEEIRFRGLER